MKQDRTLRIGDPVQKVKNVGDETVKKMQDLSGKAAAEGINLRLPMGVGASIKTVSDFQELVRAADSDDKILSGLIKVGWPLLCKYGRGTKLKECETKIITQTAK